MPTSTPRRIVEWSWEHPACQEMFVDLVGFPGPAETRHDVDRILALAEPAPGAAILDVGCGPGRHAIELARRGYRVLGIDVAAGYLETARRRAAAAGVQPEFRHLRGADLDRADRFDLALAIDHTLGFMSDDELDRHLMAVVRALRPAGGFLLVLAGPRLGPNGPPPPHRSLDRRADVTVLTDSHYEGPFRCQTTLVERPGGVIEFRERQRAFRHAEVLERLARAGFTDIASFSGLEGGAATVHRFGTYLCRTRAAAGRGPAPTVGPG